jgi:antitoxin (DNA-binding transcriptional repressor) of toxin-antitoxin stability system
VETIAASKFKATCLALLDKVKATGQPLLITKNGETVGMLCPPPPSTEVKTSYYGQFKGQIKTVGDIVSPIGTEEWEVYKDAS